MTISFTNEMDALTPDKRLEFFLSANNLDNALLLNILYALYAADNILCRVCKTSVAPYIYDDRTVFNILTNSGVLKEDYSFNEFITHMMHLDIAKLIYRFNCSLQFNVSIREKNQLRINSWGRKFCGSRPPDHYQRIFSYCEDYITSREHIYIQLLEKLQQKTSADIDELNQQLIIKMLI